MNQEDDLIISFVRIHIYWASVAQWFRVLINPLPLRYVFSRVYRLPLRYVFYPCLSITTWTCIFPCIAIWTNTYFPVSQNQSRYFYLFPKDRNSGCLQMVNIGFGQQYLRKNEYGVYVKFLCNLHPNTPGVFHTDIRPDLAWRNGKLLGKPVNEAILLF